MRMNTVSFMNRKNSFSSRTATGGRALRYIQGGSEDIVRFCFCSNRTDRQRFRTATEQGYEFCLFAFIGQLRCKTCDGNFL